MCACNLCLCLCHPSRKRLMAVTASTSLCTIWHTTPFAHPLEAQAVPSTPASRPLTTSSRRWPNRLHVCCLRCQQAAGSRGGCTAADAMQWGGGGVAAHMSVDLPAGMHAWTSAAASPCIHASILLNHPWCLPVQVKGQCGGTGQPAAAACSVDSCSPYITRSPCANDTATSCALKTCPGKYMYFNAILPQVSNRVQRACMHAAPRMIRAWPPVHAYMCKLRENPPAHACLVPMQHGRDGDATAESGPITAMRR